MVRMTTNQCYRCQRKIVLSRNSGLLQFTTYDSIIQIVLLEIILLCKICLNSAIFHKKK